MRTEVSRTGPGELTITLDADELAGRHDDSCLRARLGGSAGQLADVILAQLAGPPEHEAVSVGIVHVRLVRTVTVGEVTMMLAEPSEVFV